MAAAITEERIDLVLKVNGDHVPDVIENLPPEDSDEPTTWTWSCLCKTAPAERYADYQTMLAAVRRHQVTAVLTALFEAGWVTA